MSSPDLIPSQIADAIAPLVKGWYYDYYSGYYYYYEEPLDPTYRYDEDNWYDPYNGYDDFSWDDWDEGLPQYDPADLPEDATFEDELYYYRYDVNIGAIAVPWTILGGLCVAANIYANYEWNKMWAEGNFFLVTGSVFIVWTYLISIAEAFELPIFMRSYKDTRVLVTFLAVLHTILYIIAAAEWESMLYLVQDKSDYDFGTVYLNMLLGYNLGMNLPQIPINLFIISKELSMEYYQFLNPKAGDNSDTISLSEKDLTRTEDDAGWFLNPKNWFLQ